MSTTTTTFDPTKNCVCGANFDHHGIDAAHWASPTSSVAVAYSCSETCGELIERFRRADQRLTRAMVTTAHNAVMRIRDRMN